jgi:SAM-dependent methyltransferase
MCTGAASKTAMQLLGEGKSELALFTLLGLDGPRQAMFRRLLHDEHGLTFRSALETLSPNAEGHYLLYRFSDPTYLCSRAMVRAVGQDRRCFAGRVLDVGGGAGHLTRTLCDLAGIGAEVVLADVAFWKLWLANRFLAPSCRPVCCNANEPLPFAPDSFSLAFCSDAFHYVWSRRLLASELVRLAGSRGVVLLTHLHNLLCENESAGMPLAPTDYRNLFEGIDVRLFKESDVFADFLEGRPVNLSTHCPEVDLNREPALILLATRLAGFLDHQAGLSGAEKPRACLSVNPLYQLEQEGDAQVLRLRFPSPEYEAEYAVCKRYLPDRVLWSEATQCRLRAGVLDGELLELVERNVLLDLPRRYA